MQVTASALGGGVAALGVARMIWDFGLTRSLQSDHVPPQLFIFVLLVALAVWLITRWLKPRETGPTARAAWSAGRATLLGITLLMPGCAFLASGALTKQGAYLTALESDLRSLAYAQEELHKDSGLYSTNFQRLGFRPSAGAHAPVINVSARSWSAVNSHTMLGDIRCGIAVNTAHPITAGPDSGVVCRPLVLPLDKGSLAFNVVLIVAGFGIAFVAGSNKPAPEQASAS